MDTIALPLLHGAPGAGAGEAKAGACGAEAPAAGKTRAGNYFVANYPPFAAWTPDQVPALRRALGSPPVEGTGLGLYAHIPFCRKRCHFCYFRVYTDKNAAEIRGYIDAVVREAELLASTRLLRGREPSFVYFGGGTPSYLSVEQLRSLFSGLSSAFPFGSAREVAFEAEPGTLNESKVMALRGLGVTRLSLGIEHLDDHVLSINGRAHRSKEVYRAWEWVRRAGFAQVNTDLIAGMVEETDARWHDTVSRVIDLSPDSVTMYQMEVPYNTSIYRQMEASGRLEAPVADWPTKRRWVSEAFDRFAAAGYTVTSATTVTKDPRTRFLYRDGLFDGTDLAAVGVSSFGHLRGVNYQNHHDFGPYMGALAGERPPELPTYRAYALSDEERYIREFGLQLKGGSVSRERFRARFGQDPVERFGPAIADLTARGMLTVDGPSVSTTRAGLLEVDRLIFEFFRPEHRTGRFA